MTVEGIGHVPIGAEFSPDLKKLEKILGRDAMALFAKLQWNAKDRMSILKGLRVTILNVGPVHSKYLLGLEKWSKTNSGLEKLVEIFGCAGAVGALFQVCGLELFLTNFLKTGKISNQLAINYDIENDSEGEPKAKRIRKDKDMKSEKFDDLFREIYKFNSGIGRQLYTKIRKSNLDEQTLRFIFGLKGGRSQDIHYRTLLLRLKELNQPGFTGLNSDQNVTKLKILSHDSKQRNGA